MNRCRFNRYIFFFFSFSMILKANIIRSYEKLKNFFFRLAFALPFIWLNLLFFPILTIFKWANSFRLDIQKKLISKLYFTFASIFDIYIHTYIHTSIYTNIHKHIPKYIHIYIHTYIHLYIHTCIHLYVYIYIHTYLR